MDWYMYKVEGYYLFCLAWDMPRKYIKKHTKKIHIQEVINIFNPRVMFHGTSVFKEIFEIIISF